MHRSYRASLIANTTCGIALAITAAMPLAAQPLGTPSGPVLLTVSGAITATNAGDVAEFDLEMLEALGLETIQTTTIWTEGVQQFDGIPLTTLLDALGVEDGMLKATAVNDYAVEIPVSDAVDNGPMIAYRSNGAPMSLRDKGPLWIVYPYDSNADYRTEVIYSRSIWQLDRIEAIE